MKLAINIFFCLFAGLLVYAAPNTYDYGFCVLILVLFLINVIYYFASNQTVSGNVANFDFFFIFSYTMTNFIYPVFYKPTNPNYTVFELPFNDNVISKSTAIAYLGFTFFALGISKYKKDKKVKKNLKKESLPSFKINNLFIRSIFIVALLAFIGYVATGGLTVIQKVYSGGDGGNLAEVGVYSYFNNVFVICALLLAIFVFLIKDKMTKIMAFAFIIICGVIMLTTGSRTLILGLGLILIVSYGTFVRSITMPVMMLFILIGSFFMTVIQAARTQEFSSKSWSSEASKNVEIESPFDIFNDLIINNRNLYVLVDFADEHQNVFFLSAISDLTSPIPGLFRYVSESMNVPKELIFGGDLPTFLEFGPNSDWGLGTNLVGETYVGYSYFGVCIILFLWGFAVRKSYDASENNIYAFVIYFLLVSHAIFFPRSFYLYQPRTVVWSLLLVFILLKITNALYRKRKQLKMR
ncbi:O-antigen polysaccharide polymerase Wzy [Kaistella haifensis]|nr:O-antigen polysaccharide polymerase Wzy [Kaistella haifensis]